MTEPVADKVYVYDTMRSVSETRRDGMEVIVLGMRYMALDGHYPWGRILAYGFTKGGAAAKGWRKLRSWPARPLSSTEIEYLTSEEWRRWHAELDVAQGAPKLVRVEGDDGKQLLA